ncbi:hypothetical protein CTP10_R47080 [Cupriavidus sp. P-10]|uniref:hypothetical protein n=1 Tax=Cupriavidus sp. P-10 TaxID=2027911 RepID=UPI000E2FACBF|nr:hypothetical protein [Cupriavidus sp. P-10]BDB27303.1 hypothetical protein CTP10_R47080 [Cupriavidus sp. P-10]
MANFTLFHMWDPSRQVLIEGHKFYVEQARTRLLSQFGDLEGEAKAAEQAWLDKHDRHFDPDRHDPADFLEAAHDAGIAFYQLLSDMKERTRLSVVAGMFHEWEKQLRDWLVKEIKHWHSGELVASKVWSADFSQIIDLLEGFGWQLRTADFYRKLDACRLVVNVYKHGTGKALQELRRDHPEYLTGPFSGLKLDWEPAIRDHTYLTVSDEQFQEFSDAVVEFWTRIPERIFKTDETVPPQWFLRAMQKP